MVCAGVCLEEKDLAEGLFPVAEVGEAAALLVPRRPEEVRRLVRLTFVRPPLIMPSCFLWDYIRVGYYLLLGFSLSVFGFCQIWFEFPPGILCWILTLHGYITSGEIIKITLGGNIYAPLDERMLCSVCCVGW